MLKCIYEEQCVVIHHFDINERRELYVQILAVEPQRSAAPNSTLESLSREIACDVDIGECAV